ncbi:proline iminopeptidase-family hydrolase [Mycobacterium sp. E2479]|uniref:proline iminopeptidase-family hydrolase n=1 Tax=Mycobacterium sp. E2479 TaxID=1834134 RepID=UPI000801AD0A|nr:proline iminopeptidase-family hydrolase [Mycobacterium sp. E2479]OBH64165.1 proline iminopeptidase [Mycobacterium sp. E2479]
MTQPQGTIAVPGGNVWFKRVGAGPGLPLLVVHGGPGLPHTYLNSLQRLADEREVVFWDQLGCGNSERPSNAELWTMDRSIAEMDAVVRELGLERFHVFGNSWGGMMAQQYMLDATSGAVSLIISNSIASIPQFAKMVARLKSELDPATQAAIDRHEAAGSTHAPEYQAAIRTWNETYLCRVRPWPRELEDAFRNMGAEIFETMFGPSDFHIVGTIRNWDVVERLHEITVPTILLAGRYDECVLEHMWDMHQRIAGSRFELFEASAHMPFIEEPEKFDAVVRDFLRRQDD